MIRIVVVDDNKTHLSMIESALIGPSVVWNEDVEVKKFDNSLDFLVYLKQETFDCVVLDLCMPDLNGDSVLKCIRSNENSTISVLMLTCLDQQEEKIKLLCAGADDYLVKPFHSDELLIRVRHLVELSRLRMLQKLNRGYNSSEVVREVKSKINLHGYIFDDFLQTVTLDDEVVVLTDREYRLSKFFFNNLGVNLSKKEIMRAVLMDSTVDGERSLVTHVHLIREKLNLKIENGWILRSIYGFGYCFNKSNLKAVG